MSDKRGTISVDWEEYKRRHCQNIDFCGLDYELGKRRGEIPPAAFLWSTEIGRRILSKNLGVCQIEIHTSKERRISMAEGGTKSGGKRVSNSLENVND